jgi:hypothetical protein
MLLGRSFRTPKVPRYAALGLSTPDPVGRLLRRTSENPTYEHYGEEGKKKDRRPEGASVLPHKTAADAPLTMALASEPLLHSSCAENPDLDEQFAPVLASQGS